MQPTQLEKFDQNSKIELPWHSTKILISADLAWFTESFRIFSLENTFLDVKISVKYNGA